MKKEVHPPQYCPPSAVLLQKTAPSFPIPLRCTGYGGREGRMKHRRPGLSRDAVLCLVQICGIYVGMGLDGVRARL